MNQHTVILSRTPDSLKRLFEFKRMIEEKLSHGEDIDKDMENFTHGTTKIPEGLRNYKSKEESV